MISKAEFDAIVAAVFAAPDRKPVRGRTARRMRLTPDGLKAVNRLLREARPR